MTREFSEMLRFFGASALGYDIKKREDIDIATIRQLAIEQGIWTIIYEPLSKVYDLNRYKSEFIFAVTRAIQQREFTLKVIRQLEREGVECCILKGAAVARLYAEPDCRISSDTDILIALQNEKKAEDVLKKNGYSFEKRAINDHHLKAYHPIGGLLEIHVRLYSHSTEQIIFNGLKLYSESCETINLGENEYKVLGINDGLFYLTAHYIKHLINGGGGVRQMMDLLLYIENYKDRINFDGYFKILRDLKYERLIKVIMSIGAEYFGFGYEKVDDELMQEILDDTEKGGIFGYSADDRQNFYYAYCAKRTRWSQARYRLFLWFKSETTIINKLFPSQKKMLERGYKYARYRFFLPVAWIQRYIDIMIEKFKPGIHKKAVSDGFHKRMELMKKLNMID